MGVSFVDEIFQAFAARGGDFYGENVTQLEHAEALHAHGGAGDVRALLDPARETFVQLRATPWVERVDAVGVPVAS